MTEHDTQNVPKLRFLEFDGDWADEEFSQLAIRSKKKFNPKKSLEKPILIELDNLETSTGNINGTSNIEDQVSTKNVFTAGQVLFGKLRPYLKKYARPNFSGVCSSEIWVLHGIKLENAFLYNLVQTFYFQQLANISSGSKMPRAVWDVIAESEFFYPKKEEQKKIAGFLGAVDARIGQLEKKKALLESYKTGCMQHLFTQTIRFTQNNGTPFPDWEDTTIGDAGYFYYGKGAPKSSITDDADTPCVRYGELYSTYNEEIKEIKSYTNVEPKNLKFSAGKEVLVPRVGEDPLDFANCSYLPIGGVAIGEMISVYNTKNSGLFMAYYFNAHYKKEFARVVEGSNPANLYYSVLEPIKLKLPHPDEQRKIADFLSALDDKIALVTRQITHAQMFKKGLLQQMFV